MLRIRNHTFSIMVLYCVALHLVWAILVAMSEDPLGATALHALAVVVEEDRVMLFLMLMTASILAAVAVYVRSPWIVWFLMPQQILLLMSMAGAISAIYLSQFADGVERPRGFIAADQVHMILAALMHTVAIIAHARDRLPARD